MAFGWWMMVVVIRSSVQISNANELNLSASRNLITIYKKKEEVYTQAFSRYIEINSQIIGKLKIKGIPVKVSFTICLRVGVEEGKWEEEIDKFWIWLWSSAMYPIDRSIVALFYAWIVGQFIIRAASSSSSFFSSTCLFVLRVFEWMEENVLDWNRRIGFSGIDMLEQTRSSVGRGV